MRSFLFDDKFSMLLSLINNFKTVLPEIILILGTRLALLLEIYSPIKFHLQCNH